MARPRTYAPPVAFRLPPDYHDKLNDRALRSGLPLAVYVRDQVMDMLRRMDAADKRKHKPRSRARSKASANGD